MVLPMIAYTSGFFHIGHGRSYTACDSIHRWWLSQGVDSLCPFGYDAHGLPTELKAREEGVNPILWTERCIDDMEKVIGRMDLDFLKPRINTSLSDYYLDQQLLFVRLYRGGFISRKRYSVFWDDVEKTTLANEQVVNGRHWRTGNPVGEVEMEQWFFNLNSLSRELSLGIDLLDGKWPSSVLKRQSKWIGYSSLLSFQYSNLTIRVDRDMEHLSLLRVNTNYFNDEVNIGGFKLGLVHDKALDKGIAYAVFNGERNVSLSVLRSELILRDESSSNLRDWCISRQRSFGCPIPAVNCGRCGWIVSEELIVENPLTKGLYESSLSRFKEWSSRECPKCGRMSTRETDTLDVLFDSSWYPLKYLEGGLKALPSDRLPIKIYIGGNEHSTGHLIYIRALFRSLKAIGYDVPEEPIEHFYDNGMVNNPVYVDVNGDYVYPRDVNIAGGNYVKISDGTEVRCLGNEKMSKSKKNVITLDYLLENYTSSEIRLALLSDYPLNKDFNWSWKAILSVRRNLFRFEGAIGDIDGLQFNFNDLGLAARELYLRVDLLYRRLSFNKVIAEAFTLVKKGESISYEERVILMFILWPIMPSFIERITNGRPIMKGFIQ